MNQRVTELLGPMRLPVIASPLFIISNPQMVIAQCASGIIGTFPALNARPQHLLDAWLTEIENGLSAVREKSPDQPIPPYAVNHIIHDSNTRLMDDLAICEKHRVPLIITSLRAPSAVVDTVHRWGGLVFHDVTNLRHARKALDAGVDGLVLVCSGAGGHAGTLNPFALMGEIRQIFNGPLVLAGAITSGADILSARAMGADYVYMGTRFIPSTEANAPDAYKQMIVESAANDILYTPFFTGVHGNYLIPSIVAAGLDPAEIAMATASRPTFGDDRKPWRDIWGAGQGVGSINAITSVSDIVDTLENEYLAGWTRLEDTTRPSLKFLRNCHEQF